MVRYEVVPLSDIAKRFSLFLFVFLILTRFDFDPDLGWHLAYGGKFLASGEIIRADSFSWTMPSYMWGNSYFLYQIIVTYLFHNLGFVLTAIIFGLIAGFGVLLVTSKFNLVNVLVGLLGASILLANIGVRPHTLSFFIFSLLLICFEKGFLYRRKYVPLWFLLFLVWANIHRAFVVGLLVLGAFAIIEFFYARANGQSRGNLSSFKNAAVAIFAGILGSLVTPFGLSMWKSAVVFDLSSRENLFFIAEWLPSGIYFPLNFFFAFSGFIFVFVLMTSKKKQDPSLFLIGSALFMFSFLWTNFIFFWVAIFIYCVSRKIDFDFRFSAVVSGLFLISLTVIIFAQLLSLVKGVQRAGNLKEHLASQGYPVLAIDYMRERNLAGNIFNDYSWGGFMDFWSPEMKIFIDGRMASWRQGGVNILGDYLAVVKGKCGVLDRYNVETVLVSADFENKCFWGWDKVYEDGVAKVLVRDSGGQ